MATGSLALPTASARASAAGVAGKLFLLTDVLSILLAFALATQATDMIRVAFLAGDPGDFYNAVLPERSVQVHLMGLGLCVWFAMSGHYTARQTLTTEVKHILTGILVTALVDGYLQFALKAQPSRLWLSSTWVFAVPLVIGSRVLLKRLLFRLGPWRCPTAIIGTGRDIGGVSAAICAEPYLGYAVTETLDIERGSEEVERRLTALIAAGAVRYALISFDESHVGETLAIARSIEDRFAIPIGLVPNIRGLSFVDFELHKFFGHDLIVLNNSRRSRSATNLLYKRVFDVVLAGAILLFLSPLLVVISLVIKRDRGPVLYGSPRVGRDSKVFTALKFRSMVPDADRVLREMLACDPELRREWEENFKLRADPRITRAGRILRETSLDELPQLLNVLRGEMSLVGPRPLLLDERDHYTGRAFDLYSQVTPGLTGMWQVSGRDDLEYYRRIELNNWYIKNWSPWTDLIIVFKTFFVVLRRVGVS